MRGDQPVVSAASWIVSASILGASVANPDTVVSRFGARLSVPEPGRLECDARPDETGGPDMSLMTTIARFARSPQGRRAAAAAMAYAQSPKGRAKIEQARRQLAARGGKRRAERP